MWNPRQSASRCYQGRSEEHTSELQSRLHLVCRLLLEKKNKTQRIGALVSVLVYARALRRHTSPALLAPLDVPANPRSLPHIVFTHSHVRSPCTSLPMV